MGTYYMRSDKKYLISHGAPENGLCALDPGHL